VCVCVCVCVCVYVYVCVCVCVCVSMQVPTHTHTHTHTYRPTHTYTHIERERESCKLRKLLGSHTQFLFIVNCDLCARTHAYSNNMNDDHTDKMNGIELVATAGGDGDRQDKSTEYVFVDVIMNMIPY